MKKSTALQKQRNKAVIETTKYDDDFEREWDKGIPADEVYTNLKIRLKKHFDENGENIHLKKNNY